jgi:hypothetical protein
MEPVDVEFALKVLPPPCVVEEVPAEPVVAYPCVDWTLMLVWVWAGGQRGPMQLGPLGPPDFMRFVLAWLREVEPILPCVVEELAVEPLPVPDKDLVDPEVVPLPAPVVELEVAPLPRVFAELEPPPEPEPEDELEPPAVFLQPEFEGEVPSAHTHWRVELL